MSHQPRVEPRPAVMKLDFDGCPIEASMGTLGRKWAFLVLRNIGFYRKQRFNDMLRFTPGLTKRVLSMRLGELRRDGYIEVAERGKNYSRWDLTEKGRDALPILMSLVKFGSKWYADKVFSDRAPRALRDVFEESYIKEIIGDPASELLVAPRIRRRTR